MRQRVLPMSDLNSTYPVRTRLVAGVATLAAASSLLLGSWGAIHAQDGTSGAPPLEETNCVLVAASSIEELRGAPDSTSEASPIASPASASTSASAPRVATPDASTPQASPVSATPAASPVASPVGSPVMIVSDASPVASPDTDASAPLNEELLTEDLVAASTSLTSCLTEGGFGQASNHMTATFRGQLVGSTQPLSASDYVSLAETFPPINYSILEVENPTLVDDTTATADVVWTLANQVRSDRWTFTISNVQGVTMWTVDVATPGTLTPSLESTSILTTISQDRYSLLPGTVVDDTVLFEVNNNDGVDHEILVLRLDDGISTDVLLRTPGPQLPVGVTLIGQATIAGDGDGRLLLTGLEPGVYTVVCLLPDETGVPHLADGMETTFTVEAS
ncbi:MAG: hypothetical protein H0V98_04765 [Chloroflexia bacterium]|nr:hypothetical protein [Chloroflexia bacterium]